MSGQVRKEVRELDRRADGAEQSLGHDKRLLARRSSCVATRVVVAVAALIRQAHPRFTVQSR